MNEKIAGNDLSTSGSDGPQLGEVLRLLEQTRATPSSSEPVTEEPSEINSGLEKKALAELQQYTVDWSGTIQSTDVLSKQPLEESELEAEIFAVGGLSAEARLLEELPSLLEDYLADIQEHSLAVAKVKLRQRISYEMGNVILQFVEELALNPGRPIKSVTSFPDSQLLFSQEEEIAKSLAKKCLATVQNLSHPELKIELLRYFSFDVAAYQQNKGQLQALLGVKCALEKINNDPYLQEQKQTKACIAHLGLTYQDEIAPTIFVDIINGAPDIFNEEYSTELIQSYFNHNQEQVLQEVSLVESLKPWQDTLRLAVVIMGVLAVGLASPALARAAIAKVATSSPAQQFLIDRAEEYLSFKESSYQNEHAQLPTLEGHTNEEVWRKIIQLKELPPNPNHRSFDEIIKAGTDQYTQETGLRPFWQVNRHYKPISYYQDIISKRGTEDVAKYWDSKMSQALETAESDSTEVNFPQSVMPDYLYKKFKRQSERIGASLTTDMPTSDIWTNYVPPKLVNEIGAQRRAMSNLVDFENPDLPSGLAQQLDYYQNQKGESFDKNTFTLLYFSDISEHVMKLAEKTGQPVSTSEVLSFVIKKNNGDIRRALTDLSLFYRFMARHHNITGEYFAGKFENQNGWLSTYILDEVSVGPSMNDIFKTAPEVYWGCNSSDDHCDQNFNGLDQEGLYYHLFASVAELGSVPYQIMTDTLMGLELSSITEHGPKKVGAELAVLKRFPAVAQLLESFSNEKTSAEPKETAINVTITFINSTDAVIQQKDILLTMADNIPEIIPFISPAQFSELLEGKVVTMESKETGIQILQLHNKRLGNKANNVIHYLTLSRGRNSESVITTSNEFSDIGTTSFSSALKNSFEVSFSAKQTNSTANFIENLKYMINQDLSDSDLTALLLREIHQANEAMNTPTLIGQFTTTEFSNLTGLNAPEPIILHPDTLRPLYGEYVASVKN